MVVTLLNMIVLLGLVIGAVLWLLMLVHPLWTHHPKS